MSSHWACDYGALSLEARVKENKIYVAEWVKMGSDRWGLDYDVIEDALESTKTRARSKKWHSSVNTVI